MLCFALPFIHAQSLSIATKQILRHHDRSERAKAAEAPVDVFITLCGADEAMLKAKGAVIHSHFGNVLTAQVPLGAISEIAALPGVKQVDVGESDTDGTADTDQSRLATDAQIAHEGTSFALPKNYTGKNVVVGIIDAGIDFNHAAFADANGKTRIQRVYMPGNYTGRKVVLDGDTLPGSEFTADDVPRLTSDFTNYSHGTHCLGIAAGSRVGSYSGMAPDADIVVCALGYTYNRNQVAIANAARYILNYAKSVGKPCVISISIGFAKGPHDGSSAFCQALSAVVNDGAVICNSVGNLAGYNRVLRIPPKSYQEVASTLPNAVDSVVADVTVDTWSLTADTIGVKVLLLHPVTKKEVYASSVITSDTRLVAGIDNMHDTDFNMRLNQWVDGEIEVLTTVGLNGKFNIQTTCNLKKKSGGVHYLLAMQWVDANRVGHNSWLWGSTFTPCEVEGMVMPEGTQDGYLNDNATALGVISAGNYAARNSVPMLAGGTDTNASITPGDIVPASSFGTDINGTVHPTVSAPGNMVISALNTFDTDYYNAQARRLSFAAPHPATGITNYWGQNTGTSMAAPTVAGIVALWLEANPSLTPAQVREMLISSAITDDCVHRNPAPFGNGKVNALGGFPEVQLPLRTILSSDKYGEARTYHITDGVLRVFRVAADRCRLYTRSDGESYNTSLLHWMEIDLPAPLTEAEAKRFTGAWLSGVKGTLLSKRNPQLQVAERPAYKEVYAAPKMPTITPANYFGTQDGYYFVQPKPMEVDTLQYAMWKADKATFSMPMYAPMWGMVWRKGEAKVDFSRYEGELPSLSDGATYKWLTLNMLDDDGGYVACPFALLEEMASRQLTGDVNIDGVVNVSDVTILINHILGIPAPEPYRCDIDANGVVNVSDVTSLISAVLQ
ncbi:MAG: S8 family serine peptidase [Sodaliphilus sp.]